MEFLTKDKLQKLLPTNTEIDEWYPLIQTVLPEFGINTPVRVAAFIAQCAHESGDFRVLKENLNYSQQGLRKVFPKYFPDDATAFRYARQPAAIANRVYAGRMGNGTEQSGDGFRYCGKGLIQLTGKDNQSKFAASIGKAVEEMETYLLTKEGALRSACWFWTTAKLNDIADKKDIVTMTKRINGGTIGLEDRKAKFSKACLLIGA